MLAEQQKRLWTEYGEFQIAEYPEMLGVAGAQGQGSFNRRSGDERIGHGHAVLEGVLLEVDGRPVANILSERQNRDAQIGQERRDRFQFLLVADALYQFHVGDDADGEQ